MRVLLKTFLCSGWFRLTMSYGIFCGMKSTIDKAGRVIIPAIIRKKAGLKAGTTLQIVADDIAIHLFPTAPFPKLVRKGKRLVAKATAKQDELPEVDLASLIEEERNRWPL
jgi:AbrB family looped-hinge helix DNA binding protein